MKTAKQIAVIPARGGSKRIERKNIRPFCGQPIIGYSISAALNSGIFERVIVSTDDEEIAVVARDCGAETPFLRPAELSDDHCGVVRVVKHAIEMIGGCERACLIYATAPFVRPADLVRAAQMVGENDYVLSISEFESPIFRALEMDNNLRVSSLFKEYEKTRSQDLKTAYKDAAHFCFGKAEAFVEERSIFNGKTVGFVIEKMRTQDIDTLDDFARAEAMYRAIH